VPQGIFSHPALTESLLNSEVVHSALFLPALLHSSSFFCANFRYYIFAYVIACKPEYVMEDFKKWENPLNYAHTAPDGVYFYWELSISTFFNINTR